MFPNYLLVVSTLEMEAVCASEMLVTLYQIIRRHTPEDWSRDVQRSDNLTARKLNLSLLYICRASQTGFAPQFILVLQFWGSVPGLPPDGLYYVIAIWYFPVLLWCIQSVSCDAFEDMHFCGLHSLHLHWARHFHTTQEIRIKGTCAVLLSSG
jgi:hypothetical protein